MFKVLVLFLVMQFDIFSDVTVQNKNIELHRVCEALYLRDLGPIEGQPAEEHNMTGLVDSAIVISSDKQYIYVVTVRQPSYDKVTFCWTKEPRPFYSEEPSKTDVELVGELIGKDAGCGLGLFRALKPKDFKAPLIKVADPVQDEDLFVVVKNYNIENKINNYQIKSGRYDNRKESYRDEEYLFVKYFEHPKGGGVVFNKKGELIGIIDGYRVDEKCVKLVSGKTIETFVRKIQDKDKAPLAPKEEPKEETK